MHVCESGQRSETEGLCASEARFRRLYAAHFGFVWGIVRALSVAPRHREDLAQEVWVKAYRTLHLLRSDASERAWLAALTRRTVQHYRRREFRVSRKEQAVAQCRDDVTNPHLRFERWQLAEAVLGELSEDQRLAYVMVHGYGATGPEAALALGVSPNTVYSRLRLAQRKVEQVSRTSGVDAEQVLAGVRDESESRRVSGRVLVVVALQGRADEAATAGAGTMALQVAALCVVVGGAVAAVATFASGRSIDETPASPSPVSAVEPKPSSNHEVHARPVIIAQAASADRRGRVASDLEDEGPPSEAVVSPPSRAPVPAVTRDAAATERGGRRSHAERRPPTTLEASAADAVDDAAPIDAAADANAKAFVEPLEDPAPDDAVEPRVDTQPDEPSPRDAVDVRDASRRAWGADTGKAKPNDSGPDLGRQTEMLARAKAALNAGDPDRALAELARYGKAFPKGTMRDVAARLRIRALCDTGHSRRARRAARKAERRGGLLDADPEGRCS